MLLLCPVKLFTPFTALNDIISDDETTCCSIQELILIYPTDHFGTDHFGTHCGIFFTLYLIVHVKFAKTRPSELTYLLTVLHCWIYSFSSWSIFRQYVGNERSSWSRSRPMAVVACKSGSVRKVSNVLGVLLVYKWRSFDRSFSFCCGNMIERFSMCDIFHQFTVGERVFGDYC